MGKNNPDGTFCPCGYLSLTRFILDFANFVKKNTGLRDYAASASMSPGHLSDIFALKNSLTEKVIDKWAETDVFSTGDILYIKVLRRFCDCENPQKRYQLLRELNLLGRDHPIHAKMIQEGSTLKYWFISSLRKLTLHPRFNDEIRWIVKALRGHVKEKDLKEAISNCTTAGLLEYDEAGHLNTRKRYIEWGTKDVENLYLQKYHRVVLERAILALSDRHRDREFQAMTLLAKPGKINEMKEYIDRFLNRFYEKFADEATGGINDSSEVFQLGLQLFRTTDLKAPPPIHLKNPGP